MSVSGMRGVERLSGKDPQSYAPHALHGHDRIYVETNCYTDIIIELLHACGYEPLAVFGHLVRLDFEGDQWTFFKPPPEDLESLFGVDVHEMQPYRPLPLQIGEQIQRGGTIIVELDSWYLPDTASTSYRTEHVKTSVAAESIDVDARTFRYFHGPGLYELGGDDFDGAFRLSEAFSADVLPPYTELVRFDAGRRLEGSALKDAALDLLGRHLLKRPPDNPFERFGTQLVRELPGMLQTGLDDYHAYAFATVRMAGSAFEVCASHADWLLGADAGHASTAMREIVDGCKTLGFRLARRRQFDAEPLVVSLADSWVRAMYGLEETVAAHLACRRD